MVKEEKWKAWIQEDLYAGLSSDRIDIALPEHSWTPGRTGLAE
jgi:hypothetical protein